jgi:hypothetical protein
VRPARAHERHLNLVRSDFSVKVADEKKELSMRPDSESYRDLLETDFSRLDIDQQIRHIGQLVDTSGDLQAIKGIDFAIDHCAKLISGSLLPEQKGLVHYFCANAWSHKRRVLQTNVTDWEQPELEQEILQIRLALSLSKGMPRARRYQLLTNLGNALSHTWRCVDAIHFFNAAISQAPQLGMAVGNRAVELRFYSGLLWNRHDQVVLVQAAYADLQRALKLPLEGSAATYFEEVIRSLEKSVRPSVLKATHNLEVGDLGKSKAEQQDRRWSLKHALFLNPTNDLGPLAAGANDPILLPGIGTPIGEGPKLIGFFNAMKQEFVSGRWSLFSAIEGQRTHFSDRRVRLVNTLDYPSYSLSAERCKAAFRIAYSLLDKIGYFFNDYLNLGIRQTKVTFRTIWIDQKTKKLRPEFVAVGDSPIRALFWLSRDLYEDGVAQTLEPEARDLALTRNHLEHKYLKLHDDLWSGPRKSSAWRSGLEDTLAFSVRRTDFERQTIRLYQLVRAALIYLACTVHSLESRKRKASSNDKTVPITLPEFDDRWKL